MPEENSWRKARDEESGIGGFMEKNTVVCTTDTIPIPILGVERKTLPVFCPWCDEISVVAKTDVLCSVKISPAYKACRECTDFINEGKSFFGRKSLREM